MESCNLLHQWKVVPLSQGQLLDVRPEDILDNGLFRRCSTYRGGGGYDKFPSIASSRFGIHPSGFSQQFVAQLFGCNLDCPYCYVTRAGVWGDFVRVDTDELVDAFVRSGEQVFHLMGGAPALQLRHWPELIEALQDRAPLLTFHSDLMLTEHTYNPGTLIDIANSDYRCLFAIDIKGLTPEQWFANTRKPLDECMFWENWRAVEAAGLQAYVTFTGVDRGELDHFWNLAEIKGINSAQWRRDAFVIDLIEYDATPHVDDVPWGGERHAV